MSFGFVRDHISSHRPMTPNATSRPSHCAVALSMPFRSCSKLFVEKNLQCYTTLFIIFVMKVYPNVELNCDVSCDTRTLKERLTLLTNIADILDVFTDISPTVDAISGPHDHYGTYVKFLSPPGLTGRCGTIKFVGSSDADQTSAPLVGIELDEAWDDGNDGLYKGVP